MAFIGSVALFAGGASVMHSSAGLCGVAISLAFYASDGLSFFFPWVELRFSYEAAISKKGVSSRGAVESEYCMCDADLHGNSSMQSQTLYLNE